MLLDTFVANAVPPEMKVAALETVEMVLRWSEMVLRWFCDDFGTFSCF